MIAVETRVARSVLRIDSVIDTRHVLCVSVSVQCMHCSVSGIHNTSYSRTLCFSDSAFNSSIYYCLLAMISIQTVGVYISFSASNEFLLHC